MTDYTFLYFSVSGILMYVTCVALINIFFLLNKRKTLIVAQKYTDIKPFVEVRKPIEFSLYTESVSWGEIKRTFLKIN